jgi:hypothetical protein
MIISIRMSFTGWIPSRARTEPPSGDCLSVCTITSDPSRDGKVDAVQPVNWQPASPRRLLMSAVLDPPTSLTFVTLERGSFAGSLAMVDSYALEFGCAFAALAGKFRKHKQP